MNKTHTKNAEKLFLALFVIFTIGIFATTVFAGTFFAKFTEIIQRNVGQRLITTAVLASRTILNSGDDLTDFTTLEDLEDPDTAARYEAIRSKMQAFADEHGLIYVYFMRECGEGCEQMILDSDPEEPLGLDYTEEMDEYTSYVFANDSPTCMILGDYNEDWYGIIAAYAPVYNSAGEAVAIVGVDISDVEILETRQTAKLFTWLFLAAGALLATTAITMFFILRKKTLALEHASTAKSEFLSHMSHEIRTPLNAVMGMAEIARNSLPRDTKAYSYINQVLSSSNHLLGILNDVLDMAKIESGKLQMADKSFDMAKALDEVCGIIRERCDEKGIKFITDIADFSRRAPIGDKLRLNQVLINLLGNAVKFTPDGGEVRFKVAATVDASNLLTVNFSVSDTGIGMTEEQVARLFSPFEQANSTIAVKFGGTGLGLSISQNLVNMMGGQITVKSELHKGSEFSFELAFAYEDSAKTEQEIVEAHENLDLSGKRILLAEDIAINRLILVELLADTNVEIVEAENGKSAVEIFADKPNGYFDLVFMDIQMPLMDGYAATRALRNLNRPDAKTVPIIAMTANAYKEDVDAALAVGMNEHLSKPIDTDKLMHLLKRFIS